MCRYSFGLLSSAVIAALGLGASIGCKEKQTPSVPKANFERRVRAKTSGALSGFHGNERTTLSVDDLEFSQVLGSEPYYLKLPGTNAIFFQTGESMSGTYHVYFFDPRVHIAVRANTKIPGGAIGLGGVDNHKVWIQSYSTNLLVIGVRFLEVEGHYHIDLEQRKVLKEEIWVYDQEKGGRITNHLTHEPPINY